ncbi:hypothetical protein EAI77_02450 [Ligilactobacillus ruminis]|nr:hypothetical protein EAI77_02450 [Ligilactobacillus ruminis]
MSVNGSDFVKYSAHSVSTPSHQSKLYVLLRVISIMEGDCHAYAKKQDDLQLIANHPVFNLRHSFFQHLRLYQLHIKPSFL